MGIFKDIFGDNRVLASKNPEIQQMLTYMERTYGAHMEEMRSGGTARYILRCGSKKYFNFLYRNGYLQDGFICVPGMGVIFETKMEAYDGLLWLYNLLEEQENNRRLEQELF